MSDSYFYWQRTCLLCIHNRNTAPPAGDFLEYLESFKSCYSGFVRPSKTMDLVLLVNWQQIARVTHFRTTTDQKCCSRSKDAMTIYASFDLWALWPSSPSSASVRAAHECSSLITRNRLDTAQYCSQLKLLSKIQVFLGRIRIFSLQTFKHLPTLQPCSKPCSEKCRKFSISAQNR